MKIEQKGERIDTINIISFKDFDEMQDFYEVVDMSANCHWLENEDNNTVNAISIAMSIARTILGRPILYIPNELSYDDNDKTLIDRLYEYCCLYTSEIRDPEGDADGSFKKIANTFKRHYKKFLSNLNK